MSVTFVRITNNLNNHTANTEERLDPLDMYNSLKVNFQINSNYEISFTATYTDQFKEAYNLLKPKRSVLLDDQFYVIQQVEETDDENGLPTLQVTANAQLIDLMKNLRLDPKQPTEDNPDTSGSDSGSDDKSQDPAPGTVTIKKTDEQTTYTLQNRLDQFFNNNDQGIKYELHGSFPQAAVDCQGSLYEWLGSNLATFGAYWIPDNRILKIYDLPSLRNPTDLIFRYPANVSNVDIQSDSNDLVNDCDVYGGKMEKDITSGGSGGGSGNLDSVEGFAQSPINADFGVNKNTMIADFARRSQKVQARGVDCNKLYDTIKGQGVSPEWFFAYELCEQNSNMGWLNHWSYPHGDPYNDAVVVCGWIKQTANTNYLTPAWGAAEGGISRNAGLEAKWQTEFPKGTIGRVYLQGTAAAVWELAGVSGNVSIGKPLSQCVAIIRGWGGHTVKATAANGGSWGWPFPSVGEGTFMQVQKFGYDGGYRTNSFHDGLDFGSIDHPGSEVHAVHGGKCIISRAWGNGGINWYCVIQDSTGLNVEYQEAFGSASNITVNVGDTVQTGQVIGYRTTDHLHIGITRHRFPEAFAHAFSNDGTWLDPQAMIKNGGAADTGGDSSSDSDSTTTTTQTYYALYFHYHDDDSVKRYGLHRGPQIVMDSIYDMDALKKYVDATVQHDPPTTLSNNQFGDDQTMYHLGDTAQLIVPEQNLNTQVTLMGISYNPLNPSSDSTTLTWNNTGLTMKSAINALYQDIHQINQNVDQINYYGATGAMAENQYANTTTDTTGKTPVRHFTEAQVQRIKEFTNN